MKTTPLSEAPYVVVPGEDFDGSEAIVGGKAAQLCALAGQKLPVPPFFCVTTRALAELCAPFRAEIDARLAAIAELEGEARQTREAIAAASEAIRTNILEAGLPGAAREEAAEAFDRLFAPGDRVAVRSSAVGEDSASASFAGQMDTYLDVRCEDVADRILACLASAYSERALAYRHARELADRPIDAGGVVQRMVAARASGVLFTANPTTGDPSEIVVTAGLGLGEGVVGGSVETDEIIVSKRDGSRRSEIATKTRQVVFDDARGAGTRTDEVPEALRDAPAISEAELDALVALAERVERDAGAPQDLEWSVGEDGAIWLLQARPITALAAGRVTVFDNANIVESYPGVSLPLTFSYVRHAYAETFREAVRRFGVSESLIEREQRLFENLVSLVDGRIYYNILQWYRLYELAGFQRATTAWERSLGLSDTVEHERPIDELGPLRKLGIRAGIAANLFTRSSKVAAYLADLRAAREEIGALDLGAMEGHRLVELLEELMDRLLAPYAVAVINDFYAQQLYDVLGRLIETWGLGDPDDLRNALVAGDADLDSVKPVRSLMELAELARESDALLGLFESDASEDEILAALRERDDLAEFRRRFDEHVERYGDRTLSELKLETPTLREDPSYALRMLRCYVRAPRAIEPPDTGAQRERAQRLVRRRLRAHPLRRAGLAALVAYAREAIRHRENLRLARAQGFGLIKRIFGALGELFASCGLLEGPRDIFYLTVDEVRGTVRGTAIDQDLRAVVAMRKRAYDRYRELALPPRIVTRGVVRAAARAQLGGDAPEPESGLRGTGCSPGVVRARAAVVTDPAIEHDVAGKILIAPMTDPGWVFLMVAAAGLVVEKGSMLSHTAIIGRELGVPTVVGVPRATEIIGDGDLVEIDGGSGAVRVVERAAGDAPRAPTRAAPVEGALP